MTAVQKGIPYVKGKDDILSFCWSKLQSQCKILADEKQHLEAMVHKLKKEYEIETNYLRNQIQNEREKQNQWKNLYFQEHAELVELKRRFQAFQTAIRAQGDDVNNNNHSEKWELRGRKDSLDEPPPDTIKGSENESNPVQTSPCSIYPQVQHNIDRLRRSSISSPHRSMLQREDVQRTVLQREEDAVRPPPHHSVILPPRERFSHSQLFKPGPRQQQMIRERPPVPQYYKCPICKFYYDTEQKLHFHMELHNERFPDPVVIPNPPHPHEYPDSTLSVSPIDYYLCSECNQNFSSEDDYRRHLLVHMFKCRFCNVTLENEVSFLSHMKGHGDHSSIPFACFLCGKQFSHLQHLHAHILTHPDERPYACQECNKHFSRKGHLTRHMSTHSKEKPYVCKECNKAFAHKTHLRRHEIVHSGARPFKCRLCEHAFSRKSSLSRHYFIHTTEKPFVCPVCEKGFNRKGRLKNHLKIHIREGHHELVDYVIERRPITKEFIERINNLKPESDTEPTIRASVSSEYSDERSVHIEPSHLTQLSEVKEESDDSSSTDSEMDEGEGELSEEISYCDPIKSTSDQERHSPSYRSSTMVALPRLDDSVTPYQPSTMVALPHRSEHTKTPNEQNNNTTPYQSPVLVPLSHGENRSNSNGVSNI